jgi:hypothetical protein
MSASGKGSGDPYASRKMVDDLGVDPSNVRYDDFGI